jgi:hypothetical protein
MAPAPIPPHQSPGPTNSLQPEQNNIFPQPSYPEPTTGIGAPQQLNSPEIRRNALPEKNASRILP